MGTSCFRVSLFQDLVTGALSFSLQIPISSCFFRVSTYKVIYNTTTIKLCPILLTCHQNLLLFLGHISAGNKTCKIITEVSMATVYMFTLAMVTSMMVFHHSSSSSVPAKIRRQKVGDSLILS